MKLLLSLTLLFSSVSAFADSFELVKDGKTYLCEEKHPGKPGTSLRALCNMAQKGSGESIYHANGKVFTHYAGQKGASWYYDNGNVMTHYAGNGGASWYYSNGKVLTHYAGQKGASWYHSNGQVLTHYAGQKGATWYYDNGSVMTHSGPEMSEEELMYPCDYIE